jgi:hypothetical protein
MEKNTAQSNTTSSADDPMETEIDQSVVLPVSRRRQAERLDYKMLYDVCPQPTSVILCMFKILLFWCFSLE